MNVTREALSDVMEFDCPIRVYPDGTVARWSAGPYAPELYWSVGSHHMDTGGADWSLMTGYSGQYRYSGPIMHPSEFIGGRMADDILSTPGLYVALACEVSDCDADCQCGDADCDSLDCPCGQDGHAPAGWAVAYIADAE